MEKLSNPQKTIETIKKYQFSFQKKFGQNFLIDEHVIHKIIRGAQVTKEDFVLEIGPGIGTMTPVSGGGSPGSCGGGDRPEADTDFRGDSERLR